MADYRQEILDIAEQYARPGEDWETSLLAGAPNVIDADEAETIADWLDAEADSEWGYDPRHHDIASDIRATTAGEEE